MTEARKAAAATATAKKTAASGAPSRKAPARKAPAKKAAARKAADQAVTAKKAAPRAKAQTATTAAKTAARSTAKRAAAPGTKVAAEKTSAKKAPARKAPKRAAPRKTAAGRLDRTARNSSAQDDQVEATEAAGSPHRPSRRHLIVDAAIRVFARKGFSEASIQEIADDAGVVATAVYYHFAGKEELFEAALTRGLDASDAVIAAARPDDAPADASIFRSVIRASWDWAETSPDMARLLFLQMPGGATPVARALARDYLERHARRAYDYFETTPIPANRRRAAAEYAARTLTVRTVMGLTLSVHSLQMEGGPLSSVSSAKMVDATARLCERLFEGS